MKVYIVMFCNRNSHYLLVDEVFMSYTLAQSYIEERVREGFTFQYKIIGRKLWTE